MRSRLLLGAALIVAASAFPALAQEIPASIAAPGETVALKVQAEGAQVYECKAGTDGKLTWTFREPIATLILNGKTVGRHYAGPTWADDDGSTVTAKAAGKAPGASENDIPWLRLVATAHHGKGVMSQVSSIQRINTHGGVVNGACDQAGAFRSAPYSAEYVFLRKS